MSTIFVQIAAYRDSELLPTIRHCIERAKYPDKLTFGICFQHDENNSLEEFENDPRFKIIKVPYTNSKGACWARSKTNELYNHEDFTLQIDSHMRFIKHWDKTIVNLWESLKDSRAVLTTYPPQYEPSWKEEQWVNIPHTIQVHSFKDGQTQHKPYTPPDTETRTTPYRAVHVAAGFIFGPGSIVLDVPYDPEFYFSGEEIALAIRLYTNGYNLYHPHKVIVFHYYERKDQNKHWSDDTNWTLYNAIANERLDCLLERNKKFDLGPYCLGKKRSLRDWELYSGIDYARKLVHRDTIEGHEPPVDYEDITKWGFFLKEFNETVGWTPEKVEKCDDLCFWAFIIKDQNDKELFREDIFAEEHPEIISGKVFERNFKFSFTYPNQIPTTFMIWPYSKSKTWLNNVTWSMPQKTY
jgi:Glycosyltransferase (GlcNAc)